MQDALNILPLAVFLIAFWIGGIYTATGALMVAMILLVLFEYLRSGRVSAMHMLTTVLVLVFGGATLLLHDKRFLKLKPTVLMWLMALAFFASQWIGRAPLVQRMLEPALAPGTVLPRACWVRINLVWVAAYLLLGALNLYVAQAVSDSTWVYFKVFGLTIALAALAIGQALWLHWRSS